MGKLRDFIVVPLVLFQSMACAAQTEQIVIGAWDKKQVCTKVPGMIAGPMVPTWGVAKDIYLAVASEKGEKILPSHEIGVMDFSDRWVVSHGDPRRSSSYRGGGMPVLTMSKCDGSLSANYAR